MNIYALFLFYMPRIAFRRTAVRHLVTFFSPEIAERVWLRTLELYPEAQASRVPRSPGVNLVLHYLEWDRALYRAAQEHGLSQEQAGKLIEEINWKIFRPAIGMAFKASRLRGSNLQARVKWLLDMMFLVLFTNPFRRRTLPSDDGVAFDVVVCPLAAYGKEHGVPELTRYAACSLDYHMAHDWRVELERSQTIAAGSAFCDFRFKVPVKSIAVNATQQGTPAEQLLHSDP